MNLTEEQFLRDLFEKLYPPMRMFDMRSTEQYEELSRDWMREITSKEAKEVLQWVRDQILDRIDLLNALNK